MTLRRLPIVFALATLCVIQAAAQPRSMFVFQNSFWLNLHQFLRGEVYRRREKLTLGVDPASLSDSERARWTAVVDTYVDVAKHDLVGRLSTKTHNTLSGSAMRPWFPTLEGRLSRPECRRAHLSARLGRNEKRRTTPGSRRRRTCSKDGKLP